MEWKVLKNLSYTNSKVADTLQQESSRTMAALLISISHLINTLLISISHLINTCFENRQNGVSSLGKLPGILYLLRKKIIIFWIDLSTDPQDGITIFFLINVELHFFFSFIQFSSRSVIHSW